MSSWFGLFSVFNWTEGIPYHSYLWQMFSCFSRVHAYSFTSGSSYQQLQSLFVNNMLRRIYIVRALLTGGCLKKTQKTRYCYTWGKSSFPQISRKTKHGSLCICWP